MADNNNKSLSVFIDESGNFNFSPNGSKFYTLTALATYYPEEYQDKFSQLRQNIIAGEVCSGLDSKYIKHKIGRMFHAAEDKQIVRDEFFKLIQQMPSLKKLSFSYLKPLIPFKLG